MSGRAAEVQSSKFESSKFKNETFVRTQLVDTLTSQLYVRELTGNNDGVDVEKYLAFVGQKKGASWCAAFVSYNLSAVGVLSPPNPKSAWAPSFASNHIIWTALLQKQHKIKAPPKPGDCFTLYYTNLNRVGHVGFIIGDDNAYWITIEGNTGLTGSREGSGVHKYKRAKNKIYAITNYISNEKIFNHTAWFVPDRITNDVVQPKINPINGKEYGENFVCIGKKGFNHRKGYDLEIQRRQCQSNGSGSSGQRWNYQYAGDHNGLATNEIKRINCKGESICLLYLQGFRTESYALRTSHYRTYGNGSGKATRENYYQNYRGKVYTQMG
jgi:hypothetical protein